MREDFVLRALRGEQTKSALCREYGISRPTGDKWIRRYLAGENLADRSRRPGQTNRTPPEVERQIVDCRARHPAIGATKLRRMLENDGCTGLPCARTVNDILKRNNLIRREDSLAATPHQRFVKDTPNEMWQADYKGHFALKNGEHCHPLNIIDDHSRFNLCCEPMRTETFAEIQPVMIRLFETYGMPFSLLCDNGNPWGTAQATGYTQFEVWMMELGVLVMHGRPLHPQTQGKEESFNRSLTRELLCRTELTDFEDARAKFEDYRAFYNDERPHHALNLDTPSEHYCRSPRPYSPEIPKWEYPDGCELRAVQSNGFFCWRGQLHFLSYAFAGKKIAVRRSVESTETGCFELLFRGFRIAVLDAECGTFASKKVRLLDGDPRLP